MEKDEFSLKKHLREGMFIVLLFGMISWLFAAILIIAYSFYW